jgi:adenosylcobinamide-phosphate synthase
MGVAAAALGVRLEKPGAYALPGGSALPTREDVSRARRLCATAGLLAYLLAGVVTWG